MGYIYQRARKIYRLYQEAIECYKKAAKQGDTQAKFYLGETYYHGEMTSMHYRGVKTDYKKAFKWYSKAANEGHADAQAKVGMMYYNGQMVERDLVKSAEWYKKAAKGGSEAAQVRMGVIYQEGLGVSKDLAQAIYWSMQAKNRSKLLSIFKIPESILMASWVSADQKREMNKIEQNLLSSWNVVLLQEGKEQPKETIEAYQELKVAMEQFKEWRVALRTQPKLMVSCLQFTKPEDKLAIENRQKETGVIPYVKEHKLDGHTYLSFGEKNVEIAEGIVSEVREKRLYKQVHCMLKQMEEKSETAVDMYQAQAKQFDRYYTLFIEEIAQKQSARNQKFKEKYPYFFKMHWYIS
ncbi:MAG: tetratricopeptide repeat protein [Candidatus Amoebophilus sp.]